MGSVVFPGHLAAALCAEIGEFYDNEYKADFCAAHFNPLNRRLHSPARCREIVNNDINPARFYQILLDLQSISAVFRHVWLISRGGQRLLRSPGIRVISSRSARDMFCDMADEANRGDKIVNTLTPC